jgi:nucleoid-associated protein YgaU
MNLNMIVSWLLVLGLVLPTLAFADEQGGSEGQVQEKLDKPPALEGRVPNPAPAPVPQAQPEAYVVREGDTLAKIAKRFLGDEQQWTVIARANAIQDPETLEVGQRLTIPGREKSDAREEAEPPAAQ